MTNEPRVAILVLNWNGWQDTIECLDSVFRMEYRNYLIVLCDNASSDGSVERIREWCRQPVASETAHEKVRDHRAIRPLPSSISLAEMSRGDVEAGAVAPATAKVVMIHNGDNLGFAQGNNIGLQYVIGQPELEFVWLLNNDVVVDSRALTELIACATAEPDVGGVGATIFEYSTPEMIQAAGGGVFSEAHIVPQLITTPQRRDPATTGAPILGFVSGACMLIHTDVLRQVGLIDESFFIYCEDVDIGARIRARGARLLHAEASRIWHKGGSAMGHRSARHDYYTVRNTFAVVRKHYPGMTHVVWRYFFLHAFIPKIIRGQWARFAAAWRGYRDYRNRVVGRVTI